MIPTKIPAYRWEESRAVFDVPDRLIQYYEGLRFGVGLPADTAREIMETTTAIPDDDRAHVPVIVRAYEKVIVPRLIELGMLAP